MYYIPFGQVWTPLPYFFAFVELAFIFCSVSPCHHTIPLLVVVLPLTFILYSVRPCLHTSAISLTVFVLAFVLHAIGPWENTVSMFQTIKLTANIDGAIYVDDSSFAFNFVIWPVAFVKLSLYQLVFVSCHQHGTSSMSVDPTPFTFIYAFTCSIDHCFHWSYLNFNMVIRWRIVVEIVRTQFLVYFDYRFW